MDESTMMQNRRSRRSPVLLAASVEVAGVAEPVKLRNLSEEGALIEGECLPVEGSETLFRRNDLCLQGRVVWVQGSHAGISFDERLERSVVLRHISRRTAPQPPPRLFARPAVTRHAISPEDRLFIEEWMSKSGTDKVGE
jgi:hypothetical protein